MVESKFISRLISFLGFAIVFNTASAQYCDSVTPSFVADLSASPYMTWISPDIVRDGSCCGSTNPDRCLEFIITLHPDVIAIEFNIASGAVPPGALFYQVDCGPIVQVGEPICLNGVGPHHLTFCKPGNNNNTYSIISYSEPIVGPDMTLNAGCSGELTAQFYNEPSITWTSIYPGAQGTYDNLLSCTSGCDTTTFTAPATPPAYIDYMICGNDLGGCNPNPYCDTVRVNLIEAPQVNITSTAASVCTGETATLTANASMGTGPYNFLWSTGSTATSIVVGPGQYYVDITDASGCMVVSDTFTVVENLLPPVAAGNDVVVCDGASVTLNGSGATSYTWSGGITNGVPFNQAVGTQNYTVTGTDANGCTNTDVVTVTVNPLPNVNAGLDQVLCAGNAITLNGAGASNYAWNNGVSNGVPFNQGVGTTTYTVTGTDANGCVNTDQVNATVYALPNVSAGVDQAVCDGEAVVLQGSGAVTYTWDNGVTNAVSFVPAVGTVNYTVTGTDANGCVNTDVVAVTVNALPNVVASNDVSVCEGTSATLFGSGASTYAWTGGITNGVAFYQNVGTQSYTVTGTDANGCSNSDVANVVINPIPVVDAGLDQSVCLGVPVTLNGSGADIYTWNNGVTNGVPFNQGQGTVTYTVTGITNAGCSAQDQVDVTINELPIVGAGPSQSICYRNSVVLQGSGANTYTWDNGVQDGVSFEPLVGTILYTVTGTDINGCVGQDQVSITVYPLPNVNAGFDVEVCEGEQVALSATGADAYSWSSGIINGLAFTPSVGSSTYVVTGIDANNCVNSDTVEVTVNPNPYIFAGPDQLKCEKSSIVLSATTNATTITWDNGVTDNVPFQQGIGTVQYKVTGSFTSGCSAIDSVIVKVFQEPEITAPDIVICEGDEVTLSASGALYYEWSDGVIDSEPFIPSHSGFYYVTGTDSVGCRSMDSANILIQPAPYIEFEIENMDLTSVAPSTGFINYSYGATEYIWDFGFPGGGSTDYEPYATFPYDQSGEYEITLTGYSENGCIGQAVKYIHVFRDYTIFVPNAFTPDKDDFNETFKPVMTGFDEFNYVMYIYNRWGQLIFESHDMNRGWDGTYASQDFNAQDAVYTWKIEAQLKDSQDTKLFVGHVTVIK